VEAEVSQRHLSFVESGRARPSAEMVGRLAETLAVPPREANALFVAAGHAPRFRSRPAGDPEMAAALEAVEAILAGHEPNPALAVDRHWTLLRANGAAMRLMGAVAPALREPPVNVLRLSLHPEGLAPAIENLREWRAHVLHRLGRELDLTGDAEIARLREELAGYPLPPGVGPLRPGAKVGGVALPFALRTPGGVLRFIGTTTVFGTALDMGLAEMTIECFYPLDDLTRQAMAAMRDPAP
jgi:hypothetical protein